MKREITFSDGFNGVLQLDDYQVKIGHRPGTAGPYDLTFGALAGCLYATFLGISKQQVLTVQSARVSVYGEHRQTTPTTLKKVKVTVIFSGASDHDLAQSCLQQASEVCSMYQTIKQVAEMSVEAEFEEASSCDINKKGSC